MADPVPRLVLRDTGTDTVRGIVLANLCFFLLTVGDVATVWALPVMGVVGAMLGRGIVGAVAVGGLALNHSGAGRSGLRRLVPVRTGLVVFRSLIHAGASLTWYVAWQLGMPLAESYAVGYAAPIVMTLMAVPMLGERLTTRRLTAVGIGFVGMLIMLRPSGALWTPVAVLLLAGVCGMALSRTMTRVLATTETAECLAFWLLAVHVPVGAAMLFIGFPVPGIDWIVVAAVLVLGVSNGLAHWLHSRAAALAPIGALAPYEYTAMLWAGLLGYLAFAQVPSWGTIAGAAVVAAAGIDNLYHEYRRSRAERRQLAGGATLIVAPAVVQRSEL